MKRKLCAAGVLFLLFYLLRFPQEALTASRAGMKLWLNVLLPTLLPFLILTGFLLHIDELEKILFPFAKFWKRFLGLSVYGAYAFLFGMLCGYPVGAKLSVDLYQFGKISRREAEYLLTFCNNASPVFLNTYLGAICFGKRISVLNIFLIFLLSDCLCMLFFRFVVYHNHTIEQNQVIKREISGACSPGAAIDISIMNGFETLTRLGGYILLFSLLSAAVNHYWKSSSILKYSILCMLELTSGLYSLSKAPVSNSLQYVISMAATAFGGLCVLLQTKSVLKKDLKISSYLTAKCVNTGIVLALTLMELLI